MTLIFSDIKKKINEKKLSVETVAVGIGMTKEGLYAALKNESLKIRDLEKIADVLKMDIMDFFKGEKAEKNIQIAQNIKGNNHQSTSDCEKENVHLKELLAEKERTIQILLNNK